MTKYLCKLRYIPPFQLNSPHMTNLEPEVASVIPVASYLTRGYAVRRRSDSQELRAEGMHILKRDVPIIDFFRPKNGSRCI